MKGEKIPKGVIRFMQKTPGGKIIDAKAEHFSETTVDTTTQPIPVKTARQEIKKITEPKAKPRTISNFADLPNLLKGEGIVLENKPEPKIEPEKTHTVKTGATKKIERKSISVLEKIFDSKSEQSKKFISERIAKLKSEDKKGVFALQQDPSRYIRLALEKSRSPMEKAILGKIQKDLRKSISKSQKNNPTPEPKAGAVLPVGLETTEVEAKVEVPPLLIDKLGKILPQLPEDVQKLILKEEEGLYVQEKIFRSSKEEADIKTVELIKADGTLLRETPVEYFTKKLKAAKVDSAYLNSPECTEGEKKFLAEAMELETNLQVILDALKNALRETEVSPSAEQNLQTEKDRTLSKLKELISKSNQRLVEIEAELATIRDRRAQQKKIEEEAATREIKVERAPKKPESQTFSNDFIKERIASIITSSGKAELVSDPEVRGNGKEIEIKIKVEARGFTIDVDLNLLSTNSAIAVKNYNIDAMWPAKGKAEKALSPYLNKVPDLLKDYIEKETGKKVTKIQIKDGQLEVTF